MLRTCKYRSQETTTRPWPILRFARGPRCKASNEVPTLHLARVPAHKASDEVPILHLARGPAHKALDEVLILCLARGPARKASDEVPILRLTRGPARKASDEVPILRLARGWLGSYPITAASTGMSRPTNATNHSHDVSRTTARHSGVTDETGVASTPCRPGQDGAGVIGRCARHCAHD